MVIEFRQLPDVSSHQRHQNGSKTDGGIVRGEEEFD